MSLVKHIILLGTLLLASVTVAAQGETGIVQVDPDRCVIFNTLSSDINIHAAPDATSAVVNLLPPADFRTVLVETPSGWYQVYGIDGGLEGWVDGTQAVAVGNTCGQLWRPVAADAATAVDGAVAAPEAVFAVVTADATALFDAPCLCGVMQVLNAGDGLPVVAQAVDITGTGAVWYLAAPAGADPAWVEALRVNLSPADAVLPLIEQAQLDLTDNSAPTATLVPPPTDLPVQPVASPTPQPLPTVVVPPTDLPVQPAPTVTPPPIIVSTLPAPTVPGPSIVGGAWSHVSTVYEHGCGPNNTQSVINLTLTPDAFATSITITYSTGFLFVLSQVDDTMTYAGNYGTSADISVVLTFTSPTSYVAEETITHESGCIVRAQWVGEKS